MSATLELYGLQATIQSWHWTGHEWLVDWLNMQLDPDGHSGDDPAPDYHEAQRIAQLYGGEVIEYDLPEYDPDVIY